MLLRCRSAGRAARSAPTPSSPPPPAQPFALDREHYVEQALLMSTVAGVSAAVALPPARACTHARPKLPTRMRARTRRPASAGALATSAAARPARPRCLALRWCRRWPSRRAPCGRRWSREGRPRARPSPARGRCATLRASSRPATCTAPRLGAACSGRPPRPRCARGARRTWRVGTCARCLPCRSSPSFAAQPTTPSPPAPHTQQTCVDLARGNAQRLEAAVASWDPAAGASPSSLWASARGELASANAAWPAFAEPNMFEPLATLDAWQRRQQQQQQRRLTRQQQRQREQQEVEQLRQQRVVVIIDTCCAGTDDSRVETYTAAEGASYSYRVVKVGRGGGRVRGAHSWSQGSRPQSWPHANTPAPLAHPPGVPQPRGGHRRARAVAVGARAAPVGARGGGGGGRCGGGGQRRGRRRRRCRPAPQRLPPLVAAHRGAL